MTRNIRNTQGGFTLIELLVVISIIGLLSSIALGSMSTARAKAADAKVLSEKHSFQVAVQLFVTQNGRFPSTGDTAYHCLAPQNQCVAAGSATEGIEGELAMILPEGEQEEEPRFALVNKAYALIGGALPNSLTLNPLVSPGVAYRGPMYRCLNSSCSDAVVVFTTKNAIPSLSSSVQNGLSNSAGTVYIQSAGGSQASPSY